MNDYRSLQVKFNYFLEQQSFTSDPEELYNPIKYIMGIGGKRLRPVFLLAACHLFTDNIEKALSAAMGIELFHNFTLLHDDIMDKAPIRRGHATVHEKWNTNVAILSGDVMLINAYQYLLKDLNGRVKEVLKIFNNTAVKVCEGQQLDMNYERIDFVSIKDYIKMIEYKTATLIAASMQIGGAIGGANGSEASKLYELGIKLGIAFQIQDDYLDIYGDTVKLGKRKGGDIISAKKTYLILKTLELINDIDRAELELIYNDAKMSDEKKVETVLQFYNKVSIKEKTKSLVNEYVQDAYNMLSEIDVEPKRKTVMENLISRLLDRDS